MKKIMYLIISSLLISCSYKYLNRSKSVNPEDRAQFVTRFAQENHDTAFPKITPTTIEALIKAPKSDNNNWRAIFVISSGCGGSIDLARQIHDYDTIPNLKWDMILSDDFNEVHMWRKSFVLFDHSVPIYILEESEYGKFVDQRVKNRKILAQLKYSEDSIYYRLQDSLTMKERLKFDHPYLVSPMTYIFNEKDSCIFVAPRVYPGDILELMEREKSKK